MNKTKNDLYKDFWDWIDSVSIKYKNYEIKNTIIVYKYVQFEHFTRNNHVKHFNFRKLLSSIKWKLKLNLLISEKSKNKMILKGNCDSINDLSNFNLYAINFSPNDPRHFLHIGPLVENDNSSLVITIRNDVFDYFNNIEKPVILLNIKKPWRNKRDLEINAPPTFSKKEFLLSLDFFSLILLLEATSLIDLLDIVIDKIGLPRTLITLQDVHAFDSVFASYFLNKIPTITLQHGLIEADTKEETYLLWKYLISDKIVMWGPCQSKVLESLGISSKKIKVLGTARYDMYIDKIENALVNNKNKRVLLGIQPTMFFKENDKMILNFIKKIISDEKDYKLFIRFHPAINKRNRNDFIRKLRNLNLDFGFKVNISNIEDPLEDILKSSIILVSTSGLAIEAMLLRKPVIEYLSKKEDSLKLGDYRDFSLHALEGEKAETLIIKLLNSELFYNKIIEKQSNYINSEIMSPPAIPRILNYINNLNNKRSIKNN